MALRRKSALGAALLALAAIPACAAIAGVDAGDDEVQVPDRSDAADSASDSRGPPTPDAGKDAAPAADAAPKLGAWIQAVAQDCGPFCASRGTTNVPSVEGAKCTSGEQIPASALAAGITYDKCFPDCKAHVGQNVTSVGKYCYGAGQNHDDDNSDVTRGCFCR